jgi:RNA polymerase sigma factor (sigma-70 family)
MVWPVADIGPAAGIAGRRMTSQSREIVAGRVGQRDSGLSQEDDRARFARIVAPHLDDAYALARWLARDRADADDILQEACVRAFRATSGFADGSARAWVLTIVRNTAFTWLRQNRAPGFVGLDDLSADDRLRAEQGGNGAEPGPTPEAELIAAADARRLEQLIAALPIEFRETLVLRDIQGLNYREIAEVTGVPLGTVMSRLARARHRLMTRIKHPDS